MKNLDRLAQEYVADQRAIETVQSVPIVLLAGISGAGKDTIKKVLLETGDYHKIVTTTTRPPRPGEENGVHYHFVSLEHVMEMLANHELIEANYYSNNVYGASVAEFQKAYDEQKIAIADIDVNGVAAFMQIAPQTIRPIFLVPPSYDEWYERWRNRYGDSYTEHLDDLQRRKATAIDELQHVVDTPYYHVVINDDLQTAVQEVNEIARTGEQTEAAAQLGRLVLQQVLADMRASQI